MIKNKILIIAIIFFLGSSSFFGYWSYRYTSEISRLDTNMLNNDFWLHPDNENLENFEVEKVYEGRLGNSTLDADGFHIDIFNENLKKMETQTFPLQVVNSQIYEGKKLDGSDAQKISIEELLRDYYSYTYGLIAVRQDSHTKEEYISSIIFIATVDFP